MDPPDSTPLPCGAAIARVIAVTGRDRATWLQGLLTNDVLALQEGQSCYSAYLTPQGRMISDMQVIALADRIWLDVPAPLAASLRERLDGLIFAEDAQVIDESASIAVWGVYGPEVGTFKGCLQGRKRCHTWGGQQWRQPFRVASGSAR